VARSRRCLCYRGTRNRLRKLGSTARIVVLTGVEDVGLIKEARDAGADAFVTKVPTYEHLMSVVLGVRPAA
jgi:FixJ family two-component response regulator